VRRGALSIVTWALIVAGVLAVIALSFAAPRRMLSPGPLIGGHAQLEADCFACHAPFRGAAWQRCTRCHQLPDIGLRTTRGVPLPQRTLKVSFHQQLLEQDCLACHVDHFGARPADQAARERRVFSHTMLRPPVRTVCDSCHAAPADATHRDLTVGCSRCHRTDGWKPADFDHAALEPIEQQHCEGCHRPPPDNLHQVLMNQCQRCHSQQHWKPATFEHDKLFVLDADHNARCATCHLGNDVRRYACYGCHAHEPGRIRAVHADEGIRNVTDCVRCHRDPGTDPEGGEARERD
jgi:hypothetical protein